MCGGDVDACFKLVDPYEEMQQRYGCSSINPQTCAAKNGMDTPISDAIFALFFVLIALLLAYSAELAPRLVSCLHLFLST
jgi:hypothetical protein